LLLMLAANRPPQMLRSDWWSQATHTAEEAFGTCRPSKSGSAVDASKLTPVYRRHAVNNERLQNAMRDVRSHARSYMGVRGSNVCFETVN